MDRTGTASVRDSRALRLAALLTVLNTAVFVVGAVTGPIRPDVVNWLISPILTVPAIYLCVQAATSHGVPPAARRFWRATTAGLVVIGLGLTVNTLSAAGILPAGPGGTALQGVGGLVMAWATFRIPLGLRNRSERIALALDMATLLAAASVFLWHFFAAATQRAVADGVATNIGALMSSALVGLLLAAKAAMAGTDTLPRRTLYLTALSALTGGIGTAVSVLLSTYPTVNTIVLLDPLATFVVALSARISTVEGGPDDRPAQPPRRYSVLPYVAAASVAVLLIVTSVQRTPDHLLVAYAAVLIIALVILRQVVAFRENTSLLTRLAQEEERFRLLVQNSTDIVAITELDATIRYVSPAFHRVLGRDPGEAAGSDLVHLIHEEDRPALRAALASIAERPGASVTFQMRMRHLDGSWRWLELITSNLMHEPSIRARVSNARDITETRQVQDRLSHDASHDALTGLANRVLFGERVTAGVRSGRPFSIVLVDLDDFKTVNDTFGHGVGDGLLVTVAERMRAGVRPGDTVARLGGDEFAIVLDGVDPDDAERVLTRIAAGLREPAEVGGHRLAVRASFGLVGGGPGDDGDDLLRRADIAMYEAKARGEGGFQRYVTGMQARAAERGRLTDALLTALAEDQLVLHYQPVVTLPEGRITGAEALVRWQHPERGLLGPGEFIPAAEESGLIVPLGRWVLREATRQAAAWLAEYGAHGPATISVNASAHQLQLADFAADVALALSDSGLPASYLTIEITESAAVGGGSTAETLQALHAMGVRLSLDDFGTGASTLTLLANCPVDEIKLDRSFTPGPGPDIIAGAVLHLARAMGVDVVAEGVETSEQAATLSKLGYDHAQGYHFARPMTADQLGARYRAALDGSSVR